MNRFTDLSALVTNAGTPFGRAVVARLMAEGAKVMAADDSLLAAQQTGATHAAHLDVTSPADWERVLADTASALGRLDVLVTIATADYAKPMSIAETPLADFKAVNAHNLEGAFLGLRLGVVKMRELGRGGSVINVGAAVSTTGIAGHAAAAASATGLRVMTKAAALSCADAKDNIRVNAIQAGPGHDPADVAAAVAFLASPQASYVTGFVLPVGAPAAA
ncbi:MAG: SDR family oxidoreductase [Rhodospirillaceae bacterium]|nr:SDR family oxidoreductase [Rhodospirillaceae bacterium]